MRITAISAVVFAASIIACRLPAQPGLSSELPGDPRPAEPRRTGRPDPFASALPGSRPSFEQRATTLGAEFGKALNAAINDELIKPEQADQMLKELEAELTIKRVRLELLRAVAMLDKAASSTPQSGELQRLRRQLKEATSVLQPRYEPADAPEGLGLPLNQRPVDAPSDAPSVLRGTDHQRTGDPFDVPSVAKPEN